MPLNSDANRCVTHRICRDVPSANLCTAANSVFIRSPRRRAMQQSRHFEAEHPCGLHVDDELELGRLDDRQVRRLRTLEDATGVDADLTISIRSLP